MMNKFHSLFVSAFLVGALSVSSAHAEASKIQPAAVKPIASQQAVAPVSAVVNINQADAATLAEKLNGIGMKKAEAIVSYREQNGPFKSIDDLVNVAGIGEATLEKNRNLISVN